MVLWDTDENESVSLSSTGGLQFANRLTSVGMDKLEGVENIVTGSVMTPWWVMLMRTY